MKKLNSKPDKKSSIKINKLLTFSLLWIYSINCFPLEIQEQNLQDEKDQWQNHQDISIDPNWEFNPFLPDNFNEGSFYFFDNAYIPPTFQRPESAGDPIGGIVVVKDGYSVVIAGIIFYFLYRKLKMRNYRK